MEICDIQLREVYLNKLMLCFVTLIAFKNLHLNGFFDPKSREDLPTPHIPILQKSSFM